MINRSLLCLALVAASGAAFAGNLLTNGNFLDPSYTGDSFTTLYTGSSAISGWTVVDGQNVDPVGSGSVDLVTGYWQTPPGGGNSIDLDGYYTTGGVAQSVSVTTGHLYDLSFELAGNPDGGSGGKLLVVSSNGTQSFTFNVPAGDDKSDMGYELESFTFTAASDPTIIEFQSADPVGSTYGPVIGSANLQAVPEPFTMALGAAGVGLAVRRRVRMNG